MLFNRCSTVLSSRVGRAGAWCASLLAVAVAAFTPVSARPLLVDTQPVAELPGITSTFQLNLPAVVSPLPRIVIAAAYIDSAVGYEPDEAILLWNIGSEHQALAGWQLTTASQHVTFPVTSTLTLDPGQSLWCSAQAAAFAQSFGALPACEWADDTHPDVPNLEGKLTLANSGGTLQLLAGNGVLVDVLVYGDETRPSAGWVGAPAQLYTHGLATAQGQIWQRKRLPPAGQPIDSDQASDWAGDLADLNWGRQVRWPGWQGWNQDEWSQPGVIVAQGTVTVAVGPEGLYQPLAQLLGAATATIDLSIYSLEHPQLAEVLAAAARRGVHVRLLLDGAPPGGITALQKWCVAQVAAAGGDVRYFAVAPNAPAGYKKRYRFTHAKFGVVDNRLALIGTENLTQDSMPVPAAYPAGGRRGFYLITDAVPVVQRLHQIFGVDWAPDRFLDLRVYDAADPKYGAPPAGYVPPPPRGFLVRNTPFAEPRAANGVGRFVVLAAPENALRPDTGLHALLARAGSGDEILLMQLYENRNWGDVTSNPIADPNPRLQALIDAARRGARVRVLLDSYFDDVQALRSNRATVDYLDLVAKTEGLDLYARLGNPTQAGLHAKLVLIRLGAETWSAVGSLNGGEVSYKLNREVVLMVDYPAIFARLYAVFDHDWDLGE